MEAFILFPHLWQKDKWKRTKHNVSPGTHLEPFVHTPTYEQVLEKTAGPREISPPSLPMGVLPLARMEMSMLYLDTRTTHVGGSEPWPQSDP